MRPHLKRGAVAVATLLAFLPLQAGGQAAQSTWYRGNLHTHTNLSDGDSPPEDVIGWYTRNGYQFLVLTDHNQFTDPAKYDPGNGLLLIGGEEITNRKAVHVNAIGISRAIPQQDADDAPALLQASIDAVRAQRGVPLINHPNFLWAFTAKEMRSLVRPGLLEIASGHPLVNHAGDGRVPSTEAMWDELLTSGMRIFAAAVDDAHHFREEFARERANPGRAWVTVRAAALTRDAIVGALDAGEFYASTGVLLQDVHREGHTLDVALPAPAGGRRYRTLFIGDGGRILATSYDNPARYTLAPGQSYVRARIEDSNGLCAWTQPVFAGK